ncbi:uncharacterized protein LOC126909558 [Daktulosphaira vitifoliae]|uniref:uncharacterized protein LOC126909558 n=1 Tax=Daktulosphaira vitifoliae TaxID=58002 RepID=UPI0021A982D4|nr:uncharacterized protein LOC126909558 [Daktulosphaira vitifoliae]
MWICKEEDEISATLAVDNQWYRLSTVPVEQLLTFEEFIAIDDDLAFILEYIDEKNCLNDNSNDNSLESSVTILSSDPAEWNLASLEIINYLLKNPPFENRDHIDFKNTKQLFGKQLRKLPCNIFERRLLNDEIKNRSWFLYSKSKNALFCFQCLIFATKKQVFSDPSVGFTNWQKYHHLVAEHEKIVIDNALQEQVYNEINYWKNLLHRVVCTIQFLSERGLAFCGEDENFGSKHNRNYLECLELISKCDPFIANHISNHGNKGRGNVSYLSSTICDEFISLMSKTVIDNIVIQIKKLKYFSIIVDSTPDNTKVDQLTIIIRFMTDNSSVVERFVGFFESVDHKSEDMETALLQRFTDLDINFKNCRGL